MSFKRSPFSVLPTWIYFFGLFCLISSVILAQNKPLVGRKAAEKYFTRSPQNDYQDLNNPGDNKTSVAPLEEVLMLNIGSFIGSESIRWGSQNYQNIGRANYGVTFLFDTWKGLDRHLRFEFQEYVIQDRSPRKLALLPLVTFPRAEKKFPLYFGFGLGLGAFFHQVPGESDFSLDYQLVGGVRFFDIFDRLGFFAELSMKNHLNLLSDGQVNGTALNTGLVFTF